MLDEEALLKRLVVLIMEMFIMVNAAMMGWRVQKNENNEIILTKPIHMLSELDNDTKKLIRILSQRDLNNV